MRRSVGMCVDPRRNYTKPAAFLHRKNHSWYSGLISSGRAQAADPRANIAGVLGLASFLSGPNYAGRTAVRGRTIPLIAKPAGFKRNLRRGNDGYALKPRFALYIGPTKCFGAPGVDGKGFLIYVVTTYPY
jgi:hypothetical protein